MTTSKIVRKFERFLFNGIPESPEQTWERNGNTSVALRQTGKSQTISSVTNANNDSEIIGVFRYDFVNQVEEFIPSKKDSRDNNTH